MFIISAKGATKRQKHIYIYIYIYDVKKQKQEQNICYRKLIHSACTVTIHEFPSC